MSAEKIAALLVGETQTINVRAPKKLLDAMCAAMLKKRPELARKQRGLITEAVLHYAAWGLLCEQDQGTLGAQSSAWSAPMITREDEAKSSHGGKKPLLRSAPERRSEE